jgi:hypothetical protein
MGVISVLLGRLHADLKADIHIHVIFSISFLDQFPSPALQLQTGNTQILITSSTVLPHASINLSHSF